METSIKTLNPYSVIIWILSLVVPVLVLPGVLDNAFDTPKTVLIILGAAVAAALMGIRLLTGKPLRVPDTAFPLLLLLIVGLNVFSFFYTKNPYYTIVASSMWIACLVLIHVVSTQVNRTGMIVILALSVLAGVLVAVESYLQFFGVFVLFKWGYKGMMVMGTIGNSNYLGAYLVFPLFCALGMVFLVRGTWRRLIPGALFFFIFGAFLCTRGRAGWVGFFLALPFFVLLLKRVYGISLIPFARNHFRSLAAGTVLMLALGSAAWFAAPDSFHSLMRFENVTRSDTLRLRVSKYFKASIWLFKQSPLFGTGIWSYRSLVYEAQAAINQREGDFFKDYPEPKPRKVHNEYLETLNDGGLVAASVLLVFLILVMRHGWLVIRDERADRVDRILASTAFSALVGILLAALFFFSFRINSTVFMTSLMVGILEGTYVRHSGRVRETSLSRSPANKALIPIVLLMIAGLVWYTGVRRFTSEMEHFAYKQALGKGQPQVAETHLLRALDYDPHNSSYCLYAAQIYIHVLPNFVKANEFIERSIIDYNGDITRWAAFYLKGILKLQTGSLFEARQAFEKSLYYNPEFDLARQKLHEVNEIIKNHDRVMIKFR